MQTVLQFVDREGLILASGNSQAPPPPEGSTVSFDGKDVEVLSVKYYVSTSSRGVGYKRYMRVVELDCEGEP